jgi:hypothetical protein
MRLLAIILALYVGSLTYYAEGLMQEVYANRLAWGHVEPCAECVGQIALLDREHVGRHAYLTIDGETSGPYLVVDCAADKDRERLRARGLVGEVDHATAARLGMLGGPLEDVTVFAMESHR